MPKYLDQFPDDYELVIVGWGQSNNRPRGLQSELFAAGPELTMDAGGTDLLITGISGDTITVSNTLTVNKWVGGIVRLIYTVYGNSTVSARVGRGLVTANTASTLTVTWLTAAAALPAPITVTSFAASNRVNKATHGATTGDRVVFSGSPLPAEITAGTTYYVRLVDADNFEIATTYGGSAVTFSTEAGGATATFTVVHGYVVLDDSRRTYGNVRVLTPFQPEEPGGYPVGAPGDLHGYSFDSDVTSFEDAALFLPFTFCEGVDGYGTTGNVTSVTGLTADLASSYLVANLYPGGYIALTNTTGARWVGKIASNTSSAATVEEWFPDTAPTGTLTFEAHIPHWRDNPAHATPGEGFRYPSNDMQPCSLSSTLAGKTYNRPKGYLIPGYVQNSGGLPVYRAGAMLPLAWKLSNLLGRRINVVHLGIDASLLMKTTRYWGGTPQKVGWWSNSVHIDWAPGSTDGLAARLQRILENMVQKALVAEGSTKTAKVILLYGFQGESESQLAHGRAMYGDLLSSFYSWLRKVCTDAGLNPYGKDAKIPAVHAELPNYPWELGGDLLGETNAAIVEWKVKDGFAGSFDTDDSPHIGTPPLYMDGDPLHFDGEGEYLNGTMAADVAIELIGTAATWSGLTSPLAAELCNQALAFLGDSAKVVSIDPVDGSAQSALCARFFAPARDSLLSMHRWSMAARRVALVSVTNTRTEYDYAYAVPTDLLTATEILNADSPETGVGVPVAPTDDATAFAQPPADPAYSIEVGADGVRVLYTNVEDAHLRYQARVNDVHQWHPLFRQAFTWQLASMLAGPKLKGDEGSAEAKRCQQMAAFYVGQARSADQNQRRIKPEHRAPWHRR